MMVMIELDDPLFIRTDTQPLDWKGRQMDVEDLTGKY